MLCYLSLRLCLDFAFTFALIRVLCPLAITPVLLHPVLLRRIDTVGRCKIGIPNLFNFVNGIINFGQPVQGVILVLANCPVLPSKGKKVSKKESEEIRKRRAALVKIVEKKKVDKQRSFIPLLK